MIEIFNCEQGSDEWRRVRLGIPTASEFTSVLAKGEGKTRKAYMMKLLGERFTGEQSEHYKSKDMERGNVMEPEARNLYALLSDTNPVQIGFIRNGNKGCSPDSLIGDDGLLEIKTKAPHLQLEVWDAGKLPAEHKAQVQGQLWIAERPWCDFVSYWPKLPPLIVRVTRDEDYIRMLEDEVGKFNFELDQLTERMIARGAKLADLKIAA
jgi:hypothetical protein